ncbi:MAG: hypothetical protein P8J87_08540 [Verrucomicrobiales bacterium]|nr:hypothetical protein [Verrucomicrobiales bacterium]
MATPPEPSNDPFPNTRWTLVENLSAGGDPAQRALEELCTIYWRPVYAFARGSGLTPEDAEDVTQGFFAQLIRRDSLASISSARGRLRSYLLHSLKHFRIDLHRHQNAQRRGGGTYAISIDTKEAEHALASELADHDNPEKIFERRWALALLDEAFARLETGYAKSGNSAL